MKEIALRLENVSKSFIYWAEQDNTLKTVLVNLLKFRSGLGKREKIDVLKHLNLEVYKGDFLAILGRNGAGKSTLLKILSGIYVPSSGRVTVVGQIAPMIELGAGFSAELSGYENIFLNASILGYGRKAILEKIDSILDFADLGDLIHMPVKNYSSGMLVRLGFSVATHLDVPILLIDEVLAVGDVGFQNKCLKRVRELHSQGRTIILITHNPEQVRQFCNRCVLINHGEIEFDGGIAEGLALYSDLFKS